VKLAIEQIRKESLVLRELEESGSLLIAGGMYNIGTGKVDFFETLKICFVRCDTFLFFLPVFFNSLSGNLPDRDSIDQYIF
jgi:hypothetical protein